MIRGGHIIYQNIVEPIVPEAEPITIDKWFKDHPIPVLRKVALSAAILAGSLFLHSQPVVAETITVDKWVQPIQQPYFSKKRQQPSGEIRFEVPRTILVSDWFVQASQPFFTKPKNNRGLFVLHDKPIVPFEWYNPVNDPRIRQRLRLNTGEFRFEVPDILVTSWWQQASEPVRRKVQRQQGEYVRLDPIADDTQINEWYQPASEPYFGKRRFYHTGESRFETPRGILITDWWQPTQQQLIKKRRLIVDGVDVFVETVTLDKWFVNTIQPYFTRRRVITDGVSVFTETVTVDKWFNPISQPYIKRSRLIDGFQKVGELPVTPFDWFTTQPDRVRKVIDRIFTGQVIIKVDDEVVTLDKWFMPLSEPYFSKRRLYITTGLLLPLPLEKPVTPYYPFVCPVDVIVIEQEGDCSKTSIDIEEKNSNIFTKQSDCDTVIIESQNTNKKQSYE